MFFTVNKLLKIETEYAPWMTLFFKKKCHSVAILIKLVFWAQMELGDAQTCNLKLCSRIFQKNIFWGCLLTQHFRIPRKIFEFLDLEISCGNFEHTRILSSQGVRRCPDMYFKALLMYFCGKYFLRVFDDSISRPRTSPATQKLILSNDETGWINNLDTYILGFSRGFST